MEANLSVCDRCGRRYTSRPAYLRHRKTHDQNKWYNCTVCELKFSRIDVLQRHRKLHGEGTEESDRKQRKRAVRACDACKKSKIRCDAALPCSTCQIFDKKCTYLMKVTRPSILASTVHHDNVAGSNAPNDSSWAPQIPTQNAISPTFALADDLVDESCERKSQIDKPIGTMIRAEYTELVDLNASSDAHYDTRENGGVIQLHASDMSMKISVDTNPPPSGRKFTNMSSESSHPIPRQSSVTDCVTTFSGHNGIASSLLPNQSGSSSIVYRIAQEAFNEFFRMPRRGTLFRCRKRITLAGEIQHSFQISDMTSERSAHLLHSLVTSFFNNFHALWPITWRQGFEYDDVEPLLYLTMTSIGAMHANSSRAKAYGLEMLHALQPRLLNACLTCPRDEAKMDAAFEALLLIEIMSLYIDTSQDLEYIRQAGEVLVAHARRIILFEESVPFPQSLDSFTNNPFQGAGYEFGEWIKRERRRRLVFGFYRCEIFSSILRDTRPVMSFEELKIQPPCKHESWTYVGSAWREKLLAASQEAADKKLIYSDLVRMAAYEEDGKSLPCPSTAIQNFLLYGF